MKYAPQTDIDNPRLAHLHRSVRFWRFTALFALATMGPAIAYLRWLLTMV
jgi:hypothetical protein